MIRSREISNRKVYVERPPSDEILYLPIFVLWRLWHMVGL